MLVAHILKGKASSGVHTIAPDALVAKAAGVLSELKIGSLVVSSDGRHAVGILSERDIVRELGRRGPGCLEEPVSAMMTSKLQTCKSGDPADSILERMTEGRFRHMPVVDDDGAMVGLVTLGDVVKARLIDLAMEKDALQGMIMGH